MASQFHYSVAISHASEDLDHPNMGVGVIVEMLMLVLRDHDRRGVFFWPYYSDDPTCDPGRPSDLRDIYKDADLAIAFCSEGSLQKSLQWLSDERTAIANREGAKLFILLDESAFTLFRNTHGDYITSANSIHVSQLSHTEVWKRLMEHYYKATGHEPFSAESTLQWWNQAAHKRRSKPSLPDYSLAVAAGAHCQTRFWDDFGGKLAELQLHLNTMRFLISLQDQNHSRKIARVVFERIRKTAEILLRFGGEAYPRGCPGHDQERSGPLRNREVNTNFHRWRLTARLCLIEMSGFHRRNREMRTVDVRRFVEFIGNIESRKLMFEEFFEDGGQVEEHFENADQLVHIVEDSLHDLHEIAAVVKLGSGSTLEEDLASYKEEVFKQLDGIAWWR